MRTNRKGCVPIRSFAQSNNEATEFYFYFFYFSIDAVDMRQIRTGREKEREGSRKRQAGTLASGLVNPGRHMRTPLLMAHKRSRLA